MSKIKETSSIVEKHPIAGGEIKLIHHIKTDAELELPNRRPIAISNHRFEVVMVDMAGTSHLTFNDPATAIAFYALIIKDHSDEWLEKT